MANVIVHSDVISGSGAGTYSFASMTHIAGNKLIIYGAQFNATTDQITGIADTAGHTWTKIDVSPSGGFAEIGTIWHVSGPSIAGANVITISFVGTTGGAFLLREVSGLDNTAAPIHDKASDTTGTVDGSLTLPSVPAGSLILLVQTSEYDSSLATVSGFTPDDDSAGWFYANMQYNLDSGTLGNKTLTWPGHSLAWSAMAASFAPASGGGAATLSSPTPSGTLGTATTATVGATTTISSGTFYAVVDSAANLSGVTASQIKAGQKASGAAALASGNATVSSTSPSKAISGLTASTLYSYSLIQNNGADSNIVSGTFTTHAAIPTITDAGDEMFENSETGIVVIGTAFGASQGSGKVYLSPTNSIADGGKVEQTVTAWTNTSVTITAVKSGLTYLVNLYLFVLNNAGDSNASGYVVQLEPQVNISEGLIDLAGAAFASQTGLTMIIHAAPPTAITLPQDVITGVYTDGSGTMAHKIKRGSLAVGDPVWMTLMKDGTPAIGTTRKITPTYT